MSPDLATRCSQNWERLVENTTLHGQTRCGSRLWQ